MLLDAVVVFFEVCVSLALAITALWLATKVIGYVVMLVEGEPLVPEIKHEIAVTRGRIERARERSTFGRPHPSA